MEQIEQTAKTEGYAMEGPEKSGEPSGTRTRDSLLKRSDPEQPEAPAADLSSQETGEQE